MICGALIKQIEETYPRELAEDWDNPGLLAGSREKDIQKVYISLDATDQAIEDAISWGADMLITHHPLIMSPLRQINTDDFIGRRLIRLIGNDISYYAIHTNHDVVTMGNLSGLMLALNDTKVLEITKEFNQKAVGIGCTGQLPWEMTLEECGCYVKKVFGLATVKIFGDNQKKITFAAVSPGSGKSMIGPALEAGVQVLITGDIGHHEGIDAVAQGLCIIDAGHYGLEYIFIKQMADLIQEQNPDMQIRQEMIKNPFQVI